MKKFGFGKKDKEGSSRTSSPAPSNPYLVSQGSDPYSQGPPAYSSSGPANDKFRDQKSAGNASDYGTGRYGAGAGSYGQSSGYSQSSRYGPAGGNDGPAQSAYGSGGYGNFGANPPAGNRYGSAPSAMTSGPSPGGDRNRFQDGNDGQSGSRYGNGQAYGAGSAYGGGSAASSNRYGNSAAVEQDEARQVSSWDSGRGTGESQGYGAYQDRQLTAEEQEEEGVQGLKDEIRGIKQQDVSSTRNALRIAQMAEETGRGTLERLQQQGERIHNTERNLDLASNQNRLAAEKAREIKTLNRSMFAVHVKNPFTSSQRVREREDEVLRQAQEDRERRDATRAAAWSSSDRATRIGMEMNKAGQQGPKGKTSLAERAKYQFEADSEDEEMENEIDSNIDLLAGAAGRMKILAGAMGTEIESQNKHIERIGGKVDRVDDEITLNRSRLDRIK